MVQLQCKDLRLGYHDRILVEGLSFEVNTGDYVCIIGANGAGKSTLMKTLLGLHKPLSGEVQLGEGLTKKSFGYLTQQKELQRDFPASVKEIVLSGCQSKMGLRPFYNHQEKKRAKTILESMGLTAIQKTCFRALSGGQQQKVLLARALCAADKMLFLDEPVTGLDPNVTRELYDTVAERNQQDKLTVVMISHDIDTALTYATHILAIGKTTFWGTKEAYLQDEQHHVFKQMDKEGY